MKRALPEHGITGPKASKREKIEDSRYSRQKNYPLTEKLTQIIKDKTKKLTESLSLTERIFKELILSDDLEIVTTFFRSAPSGEASKEFLKEKVDCAKANQLFSELESPIENKIQSENSSNLLEERTIIIADRGVDETVPIDVIGDN